MAAKMPKGFPPKKTPSAGKKRGKKVPKGLDFPMAVKSPDAKGRYK